MRQVPIYGIIGDGRMARHFCHYLTQLNLPFLQWARTPRKGTIDFPAIIAKCDPVLLLIKDDAIVSFINEHSELRTKKLIHFSGCLVTPLAFGVHPLMTFAETLYDFSLYQTMPFVLEEHCPDFSQLLPGLSNPHVRIPVSLKPFYHSFCVMSNNFTILLWQTFFKTFHEKLQWPAEIGIPYLRQTFNNLMTDIPNAFTGPLARKDKNTIQSHLDALEENPMKKIYLSFLKTFAPELYEHT